MTDPVLEIKNLSVSFHGERETVTAVKNISFSLERGKTLGIVGESGSGKSVTALAILRLLPANQAMVSADTLRLIGESGDACDLLSLDGKGMRAVRGNRISMIFQEPMTSLNPVVRCGRQVTEAIRTHRKVTATKARETALNLFREVRLPRPEEIFRSYPHELSGGQKQRVMIAMAIASGPDVLIADEPTTALDVTVQKAILELIKNLQQKHAMSVIFITHDLGLVSAIADEVLVMKDGEIVETGPVSRVFHSPRNPYTKGLLACRPRLDVRLKKLPTVRDFISGNTEDQNVTDIPANYRDDIPETPTRNLNGPPVLKAENIKTWFPVRTESIFGKRSWVKAVDEVSLEIYPGETVGLVGESGCGKTTLGRSILRLIEPTGGKIMYAGNDLTSLSFKAMRDLRKNLQIVFQDPYSSLNPRLTAGKSIMEPMIVHHLHENNKKRKEKALELMQVVGLEKGHYDRYPHEFSGGQRQRICLARALAVEPRIIICDESVSALDVSVQAQVLNLLNDLKRKFGLTYLFISHDLSVVKFMSDRIIVMKDGKIEEEGDPEDVYRKPKSRYTQQLIHSIPG